MEFPVLATLHKVAAPYFLLFMYIVQLYKEVWTILHMLGCQVVALPSTEQIARIPGGIRVTHGNAPLC